MQTVWDFILWFTTQHRNHKISVLPLKHHNLSSHRAVLLTPVHGSGTATASQHPALLLFPFSSSAIPNHGSTRWLGSGEQAEPAGESLRPPDKKLLLENLR